MIITHRIRGMTSCRSIRLFVILLLFGSTHGLLAQTRAKELFIKHIFITKTGDTLRYRMLSPQHAEPGKHYPLVLFMHGAGERGNDNTKQLANGVKTFADSAILVQYPCFVIAPQIPENTRWVETDYWLPSHSMPVNPSVNMRNTMLLLDSLCLRPEIDTTRIYITGLSMGGYGVWDAISRWPKRFAAAVPLCGGADTSKAAVIRDIPVWMFHGALDKAVPVSRSRDMNAALKKAGGHPRYTEYPKTGHAIWDKTFANPELYEWLFNQKQSK